MNHHVIQLIDILLDKTAPEADRDDAAIYLSEYDDHDVVKALVRVCQDSTEDNIILSRAGESLGIIWRRNRQWIDQEVLRTLTDIAKTEVLAYFEN